MGCLDSEFAETPQRDGHIAREHLRPVGRLKAVTLCETFFATFPPEQEG